ncbi:MAG: 50S ribosomal protein L15 [Bdellovibrionales bacterium]|nr:50S ribosomal protein L15 [Bdellovibrionales bacterium]
MDLSKLAPVKGARKKRKRIGRGNASGWGRTAGKGEKGQKARAGASIPAGFEGGQMPLYRRLPKRGFTSREQVLGTNRYLLVTFSDLNRFDDGATVDPEALAAIGRTLSPKNQAGYKVLTNGELKKKVNLKVHAISAAAKAKIEALGGTVELLSAKKTDK